MHMAFYNVWNGFSLTVEDRYLLLEYEDDSFLECSDV
jgi:hypothetical protein